MTEGDKKRKTLFDRFSDNLKLLVDLGLLPDITPKFERTYICPICLDHFSVEALDQTIKNPLTLEDAPPKSLGGKPNCLTCRSCNNHCGQTIDYHLTERMIELDRSQFLPKTEFNAKFEHNGTTVQGTLRIEEDGKIIAIHKKKTNHPTLLETFIKNVLPNRIINLTFLKKPVDPFKLQLALLKTGFLMTFSKYGYSFILNPNYNIIRQQLLNPNEKIFPDHFWFQLPFPKESYGVPFIIQAGLEAILPIFSLTTESSERPFATIIPLTNTPMEETILKLKNSIQQPNGFSVEMDPMENNIDYLTNVDAIRQMLTWIENKKQL